MGRRTVLLIAALVLAGLGTVAVWLYANNARQQGDAAAVLVEVLVAKSPIEVGTTGAAAQANGALAVTQVRASDVVPGAQSEIAAIESLVATVKIFPGQQILLQQFATTSGSAGLSIPPGKIAISVQLSDPQRVAGFVAPGSQVAILATGNSAAPNQDPKASVRTLLAPVTVIAVGPTTVVSQVATGGAPNANAEQIPRAILTLAVTQREAEKIVYVVGNTPSATYQNLYLGLMTEDSKVVPQDVGVNTDNLFR